MNAWLITWEIVQSRRTDFDKIVAILSSRRSVDAVADFVQLLYLRSTCSAENMAYYANRQKAIPFKVEKGLIINEVPHGDRVLCGSNTCWLYARKVAKLKVKVDETNAKETITWVEPPEYKWKGGGKTILEFASEGGAKQWERNCNKPLSKDIW